MAMQVHFNKTAEQVAVDLKIDRNSIMTLVSHTLPHLDEIIAFILFILFGERMFPAIKHVCFDFCKDGEKYRGKDFWENLKELFFVIGTGGGPCDEHPTKTDPTKPGKCAAILVAEYLKVRWLPELQKILQATNDEDLKKQDNCFTLATRVQVKFRLDKTFEEIFKIVESEFFDVLNYQKSFLTITREEYRTKAIVDKYIIDNKKYPVVIIESDDLKIAPFARSRHGCHASIVIQKNSKGLTQISSNDHLNYEDLPFDNIVAMVRLAEMELEGSKRDLSWSELVSEGKISGVENWFYHYKMGSIMNGSESYPDMPPTKIPLEILRGLVKIALTPELFDDFLAKAGIEKTVVDRNEKFSVMLDELESPIYKDLILDLLASGLVTKDEIDLHIKNLLAGIRVTLRS